ncbi:MAG: phage tail protein [Schleiferilactobacillus perolens]|uniref:phage tail protein n=1 Tax=Schleiferilactobacillus perolens TaxID=100468 RepID=UPI0039EBC82E
MASIEYNMQMKGLDKLVTGLLEQAKMSLVKQIIKQNTAELQQKSQQLTTVAYKGHMEGKRFVKPTGATRRGIGIRLQNAGLTGIVGMSMEYNPYLEYGTRFMRARPVLKPAFEAQKIKFINDLKQAAK